MYIINAITCSLLIICVLAISYIGYKGTMIDDISETGKAVKKIKILIWISLFLCAFSITINVL